MNVISGDFTAQSHVSPIPAQAGSRPDWDSALPDDAVARIWKPSKSAMTSGRARTKAWKMSFPRRTGPWLEPLMGWTGGDDTIQQIDLSFPTLDAAIRHAKRLGVAYEVHLPAGEAARSAARAWDRQAGLWSDATLSRLGLSEMRQTYRDAMAGAKGRGDPKGGDDGRSPIEVALDASLSLEARRSILMNWAYTEYLQDLASTEGMPENQRESQLAEVERALLALEAAVAADGMYPPVEAGRAA
ncbi:NADH dehydrogenase ubiquinone Fe-S protein 4 [Paracoccus sp. MKU1]|uniref:NADH dehydrogenase ubiquinone Fe-S protein 4 n=1 Tax=Paracoccus sp. MKU1 TaxID=1745182 RepID=UPI0007EF97B8|nr:NADH dehydrogenase ubiquinone Fe-S protein 4 [Paracoccus sp. MKU1]